MSDCPYTGKTLLEKRELPPIPFHSTLDKDRNRTIRELEKKRKLALLSPTLVGASYQTQSQYDEDLDLAMALSLSLQTENGENEDLAMALSLSLQREKGENEDGNEDE